MNKKSTFIVITTTLFLTACGGGSDGSSSHTSANSIVRVNPLSYPQNNRLPIPNVINETIFQINNATKEEQKYALENGIVPNTNFTTRLNKSQYLLTKDKMYNNEWVKADIHSTSRTTIVISPVPNISETSQYQKINLGNKKIYDVVYPGFKTYFDNISGDDIKNPESLAFYYYKQKNTDTFSNGASCYQKIKSTVQGGSYISFDLNSDENKQYVIDSVDYLKFIDVFDHGRQLIDGTIVGGFLAIEKAKGHTVRIIEGNWAGYDWRYYLVHDQYGLINQFVFLNNNGILVEAVMKNFEDYDLNKAIAEQKARLNSITDKTSEIYEIEQLQLNNLKIECEYFNQVARDNIVDFYKL